MTKADEGVAPPVRCTTHVSNPGGSAGVGVADLTHELVRGQLSEYLDGTLGENERRRLDGHLASCPPCMAYLHTLRATVRELGKLPAPKAPSGMGSRIVEQAREQARRELPPKP